MYCMIEVAFGDQDEAHQVVAKLLEAKMVASCQIVESESHWNWQGKIESSKEYLVFMKTRKNLQKKVSDIVKQVHSYECFEFAVFELDSPVQDYLDWLDDEVGE